MAEEEHGSAAEGGGVMLATILEIGLIGLVFSGIVLVGVVAYFIIHGIKDDWF